VDSPSHAACLACCLLPAGWFSLNVPSGLTLYWFVNNIISTAMQIYMKKTIKVDMPPLAAAGEANAIIDVTGEVIKPKEDREKKVRVHTRRMMCAVHGPDSLGAQFSSGSLKRCGLSR
jgi:YidC/Oxa1 family membrane protein insertase